MALRAARTANKFQLAGRGNELAPGDPAVQELATRLGAAVIVGSSSYPWRASYEGRRSPVLPRPPLDSPSGRNSVCDDIRWMLIMPLAPAPSRTAAIPSRTARRLPRPRSPAGDQQLREEPEVRWAVVFWILQCNGHGAVPPYEVNDGRAMPGCRGWRAEPGIALDPEQARASRRDSVPVCPVQIAEHPRWRVGRHIQLNVERRRLLVCVRGAVELVQHQHLGHGR